MRYTIRRIDLVSAARLGCLLSGPVMLLPALCLSGLVLLGLQQVHQAFSQVEPVTFSLFGQELLRLDVLEALRLQPVAQRVEAWVRAPWPTFLGLAVTLMLGGGVLGLLTLVLVSLTYNLAARAGWGLTVEAQVLPSPAGDSVGGG